MTNRPTAASTLRPVKEPYLTFDVLYVTDRKPSGNLTPYLFYGDEPGDLTYGVVPVSVPLSRQAGEIQIARNWFGRYTPDPNSNFIMGTPRPYDGLQNFKRRLFGDLLRNNGATFLYLHGYNTDFQEAILQAAQLDVDLNFPGLPIVYSWSSSGQVPAYFRDETAARLTEKHLSNFLTTVFGAKCRGTLNVIAHSMGVHILSYAPDMIYDVNGIPESKTHDGNKTFKIIDELIVAAPDVDTETFKRTLPSLLYGAYWVTIYSSPGDSVLYLSEAVHQDDRVGAKRRRNNAAAT